MKTTHLILLGIVAVVAFYFLMTRPATATTAKKTDTVKKVQDTIYGDVSTPEEQKDRTGSGGRGR